MIKRGKEPNPIQFGHNVLVIEDAVGFICHYEVVESGMLDQDLVVPVMKKLQQRFHGKIKRASFDWGFHTPENQEELAEIVGQPVSKKGEERGRQQQEEATLGFRQAGRTIRGSSRRSGRCNVATGWSAAETAASVVTSVTWVWASWAAICRCSVNCCWPRKMLTARRPSRNASAFRLELVASAGAPSLQGGGCRPGGSKTRL